jgi:hypothetical protein
MTDQPQALIAIHPIQTGQVQIKSRQTNPRHERREARVLDLLLDRQWTPRLPISCYAIEHPDGVIVVDRGEHLVLLTGDATYSEDLLLRGAIDGVAQDPRLHRDSTERIQELCARRHVIVVPTHDPHGAERLVNGQITRVEGP